MSAKPETHDDRHGRAATGTPRRLRPSATLWLLAIPVFVGTGLLLFGTGRLGLGVSHDSVIYLDAAQTLSATGTLARPSPDGQLTPFTHYPPLYPWLLATLGSSVRQIHENARLLNVVLFGATLLLVGALAFRCGRGSAALAVVSCGLAAASLDLLVVYSRVWSALMVILIHDFEEDPSVERSLDAIPPLTPVWQDETASVYASPPSTACAWGF